MCRLTAYVGPPIAPAHLVTRPSRSIIRQSYAARERVTERGYLNGDGFGLGWYPLVPVLEDSPSTCAAELRPNQGPQDHRAQPEHSSCSTTTSPRESCENEDANDNQQQQEQQHHAPCSFSSTAEARHRASLEAHGPDIPPPNSESLAGTCFQRSEPCVFTGTGPAWNSTNLRQLSESITASIVFAHVRAATEGTDVTELSCHPFRFGRYMFMHNGNIGNFERVRRLVLPTLEGDAFDFAVARGSSDSALCFAMFLNRLPRDPSTPLTCEQIREHVVSVIKDLDTLADKHNLRQASMLNFVLTDGEHTVCTRYLRDPDSTQTGAATLYFSAGAGYECVHDSMGVYRMSHADRRHRVVIVASEPLTNTTSDWLPVPPGYTLTISREIDVLLSPIHGEQPSCHPSVTDCLTRSCVPKSAQAVANCDVSSMTAGHHDISHTANVLCFEIVGSLVFTGSNASTITVWDSETWRRLAQLEGHDDAVLSLTSTAHANARCHSSSDGDNGHDDGGGDGDDDDSSSSSNTSEGKAVSNKDKDHILFSASSDSTVRSWRANAPFSPLMTVSFLGMGDVTSLAILGRSLFAGFQDTKIRMLPVDVMLHPIERVHSQQRSGDVALDTLKQFALDDFNEATVKAHFQQRASKVNTAPSFSLAFICSRDCTVRSWDIDNACSTGMCTHFPSEVLSLALVDPFLFCGLDDGSIHLISPSTLSPRFILGHGSPGPVQCMMIDVASHRLFSAVDHNMRIWSLPRDLTGAADTPKADQQQLNVRGAHQKRLSYSESHLHEMLEEFVSLKSVSSDQSLKGECFDAARYLQQVLKDHGCSTTQVGRGVVHLLV
ncbi:hypothetical protein PTSG_06066 [Salpingoeca rosetta]|uniref:Glutamine amidotransferase type-2 domain-containing protein n=1 Tax=Salpingoeca rosetta (strain ATCC 50818 / BSB-021) TaxID=946362 RepID=F2UDL0_SALR5|nr:uncharacterized protein PTSG_06066 [Salpingoeca rosetta]EGD74705.1 hypothetical protein PTSG_06066 [Salpingoeca rosetta]|eukprot:XP_004992962.1 hypothetical protein PTSG_06066 [Salpingoeca rosetta]